MRTLKSIRLGLDLLDERRAVPRSRTTPMEKGRSMNTKSRQAQKSQSVAEALTFNVAGLLGEPVGSIRDLDVGSPPLNLGPTCARAAAWLGSCV